MNTLKERLENRTNKVIQSVKNLGELSSNGDKITPEQVNKIREALLEEVNECCDRLEEGRGSVQFKL